MGDILDLTSGLQVTPPSQILVAPPWGGLVRIWVRLSYVTELSLEQEPLLPPSPNPYLCFSLTRNPLDPSSQQPPALPC